MNTIDLTPIVQAVIALVFALISAFLIPFINNKVANEKLAKIKMWVKVAVEAAEQIYTEDGRGSEKKAYVMNFLDSKGYTFDAQSIDNLIESAVLEMNKQLKE